MKYLLILGLVTLSACNASESAPVKTTAEPAKTTVTSDILSCQSILTSGNTKEFNHTAWDSDNPENPTENIENALKVTKQYIVKRGCKVEDVKFNLDASSCLNDSVCYIDADVGLFYIHSLYDNWTSVLFNNWG